MNTSPDEAKAREAIYRYVVHYKQQHDGLSPFLQEIADACLLGVSTVKYHLMQLEIDNRIHWHSRRGIEVVGGQWLPPRAAV